MSLRDFQRALSDMTLDTRMTAAVRKSGPPALTDYELTALEEQRLVDVARQPGMDLNCSLARGNRFVPIVQMFPLTCELLKPWLRELLDELWSRHRPDNYQLAGEEDAFASFIEGKIGRGELAYAYAEEVFRYESACLGPCQIPALRRRRRFSSAGLRTLPPRLFSPRPPNPATRVGTPPDSAARHP